MNPKHLFGLIFILLLSIISVNAALTDNIVSYWKFDENTGTTATDSVGSNDGTISGPTWTTGKINSGLNFDGTNDEITSSINPTFTNTGSSISVWVYPTSNTANSYIINSPSSPNKFTLIWFPTSTTYNGFAAGIATSGTASSTTFATSSSTASINNWYHIVATNDGSITRLYINGVLIDTATASTITNIQDLCVGSSCGNNYFQGKIDEPAIWDRALTQTEITELYNSGNGLQYPFTEPILSFANISVNDETLTNNNYFSSTELNFFIEVFNTSTNGIIAYSYDLYYENMTFIDSNVYPNEGLTKSFSLTGLEEAKYFIQIEAENNETNVSENYYITIDLTPPTINNNIPAEINSYTFSPNSSCDYIGGGYCNISIDGQDIALNSTSITLTHNGNISYTITAEDAAGNTVIEEGVLFVGPLQCWSFVYLNSTLVDNILINNESNSNPYCVNIYDIGLGNYTFFVSALGLISKNITSNFNTTSDINDTITLYNNYLKLNIYDTDTNNLITQLVDIDLIGPEFASSFATSNGTITITNISELPAEYRLSLDSSGYETLDYYFTHTGYSLVNLSLYMQNATGTTPITYFIEDIFSNRMGSSSAYPKCLVKISEYDISTNSYIPQTMEYTNSNGEVVFNIDTSKYIKPTVVCPSGTYEGTYNFDGEKIASTPIPLTIGVTEIAVFEDIPSFSYEPINYTQVNNVTGRFTFTYSDSNNVISQVCLNVTHKSFSGETGLDSQCLSTATGSINVDFTTEEGETYIAYAYFVYNDETYDLPSYVKTIAIGYEDLGIIGLFAALVLVVLFSIAGLAFPGEAKVWAIFFGGTLGLWISSVIGLIPMNYYALTGWSALLILGVIFS